ncbi:DUF1398 family protein [Bosea sp. BH3]|uniref:DUF1398 family protein n=1 Tax=Bosea sp. BH3 TaxID=2871701 RepID=UPI0021CB4FCD|nr:DUF1398 family protein [Bosea sp. BH3]MCU4179909.1 DUF1398 family protein [Bosea sp. BH3]
MDMQKVTVARDCLVASYAGTMAFPDIVQTLRTAGFEGYLVDYRRAVAVYYPEDGDGIELAAPKAHGPVAATFDTAAIEAAVRAAQANAPGYSYDGFCRQAVEAGCAGYIVSFPGRRVVYFGRSAEMHTEHFPR